MTTKSGSNFLKDFRVYGEEKKDDAQDSQDEDESDLEVEYQDVFTILNEDSGLEYQLPRHQKCTCHLLSLNSTVDATGWK